MILPAVLCTGGNKSRVNNNHQNQMCACGRIPCHCSSLITVIWISELCRYQMFLICSFQLAGQAFLHHRTPRFLDISSLITWEVSLPLVSRCLFLLFDFLAGFPLMAHTTSDLVTARAPGQGQAGGSPRSGRWALAAGR